jgi:pterin-4a-carbinolamine dehydratase
MELRDLMTKYLHREEQDLYDPLRSIFPVGLLTEGEELPLTVDVATWQIAENPERLVRIFEFGAIPTRNMFITELLEMEKDTGHHADILIQGLTIRIDVYTHDLMRVTELDKEYADYCDDIFQDISLLEKIPMGVKLNVPS